MAATAVASRSSKASDVPACGRVGYLAASQTEVALFKTKSGALKMKVTDEVLARPPGTELVQRPKIGKKNATDWSSRWAGMSPDRSPQNLGPNVDRDSRAVPTPPGRLLADVRWSLVDEMPPATTRVR